MLIPTTHQLGQTLQQLESVAQFDKKANTYSAEIRRDQRTAFVFLVDQSGSMDGTMANGQSKAQALADAVNKTLAELVAACTKSEGIQHYFDVALIGYGGSGGHQSESLWEGELAGKNWQSITDIANNAIGQKEEEITKTIRGKSVTQKETRPFWLKPKANSLTPMGAALEHATALLAEWTQQNPNSFPPIVLNLSDGAQTDCDNDALLEKAKRLKSLHTKDGNVILACAHLSTGDHSPVAFPYEREQIPQDEYAQLMYSISSELPELFQRQVANLTGKDLPSDERFSAMIYNADSASLIKLLDIGTRSQRTQAQKIAS